MFDMSWGEIMVIGGVALIVIGPKDLPKALRTVGQMTTKVRRLAGEFQAQFSEAMREAELESVKKEVEGLNRGVAAATSAAFNPIQTIRDELKSSVETKPDIWSTPPEPTTTSAGPHPAALDAPPVEEVGPIPTIQPLAPAVDESPPPASDAFGETAPLVPLPVEAPSPPIPSSVESVPERPRDNAA